MITNAGCTVYQKISKDEYKRTFVPKCCWQEISSIMIKTTGTKDTGQVQMYIPIKAIDDIAVGDLVVKGEVRAEIGSQAQLKAVMDEYNVYKVIAVDKKDYCSKDLQHWELILK